MLKIDFQEIAYGKKLYRHPQRSYGYDIEICSDGGFLFRLT